MTIITQIEGFKLHVVHNLRPFVNRVRYTPEVASKPDRMEKDLATAKILAHLLEDEAATLRKIKVPKTTAIDPATGPVEGENGHAEAQGDVNMADMMMDDGNDDDDDDEPEERGSEAVERRIEKVMAEIRDRGLVDLNDEKALQAKRVCLFSSSFFEYQLICGIVDCSVARHVHCILASCFPHMLLLCRCNGSLRGIAT